MSLDNSTLSGTVLSAYLVSLDFTVITQPLV